MKKSSKLQLKVTHKPKKAKVTLKWISSNKKVAKVTKKGVVIAQKKGTVKITAKYKNASATCKIKVGTPVKTIKTTSKITLQPGQTNKIHASVSPAKATIKSLTYHSKNSNVASVSRKGLITANVAGRTTITVKSKDGNNVTKKITVIVTPAVPVTTASTSPVPVVAPVPKQDVTPIPATQAPSSETTASPNKTASTNAQIEEALRDSSTTSLLLQTDDHKKLTIPAGTYTNIALVVDMPNGEVENNATFKTVTINQIAKNTYIENATGNTLTINAKNSHIIIKNAASAKVVIGAEANDTTIDNNGTVEIVDIQTNGKVNVQGDSTSVIPTQITSDVNLITNQKLQVASIKKFTITLKPGAEGTTVEVKVEADIPNVCGVGSIPVTITTTGELTEVISERTDDDDTDYTTVKFSGSIQDNSGTALTNANVYMIPYKADYDLTKIASDDKAIHMTSDASGNYSNDTVKTGNYILSVQKSGYQKIYEYIIITSIFGNTYCNESIKMLPSSKQHQTGTLTGIVTDSTTGDPVSGITLIARENYNNTNLLKNARNLLKM